MSVATIAIIGDGVAAWMAAATLARRLPAERFEIILVAPLQARDEMLGAAATALPSLAGFHAMLGLGEELVLRAAQGSVALGAAYAGWNADGSPGFLPFGAVGAPLGPVAFHQLAARLRGAGATVRLANYSAAALAAQAGRFGARLPHGLHLDLEGYRELLRDTALALGARLAAAPLTGIAVEDGRIAAVAFGDTRLEPKLVLDCSGPARLAIGTLGARFASWQAWLPCDRMSARTSAEPVPPLYAQMLAEDAGWTGLTPLASGTAELRCTSAAFGDGAGEPYENGRLDAAWIGNCVAIGTAAGLAEPLHPVGLHLVQSALARLVTLLPATPHAAVEAAEFNRITGNELDGVRDFLALHFATTTRPGAFWDAVRAAPLPERTAYKRKVFEATGRIVMYDDEMFDAEDWITLFDAQSVRPRQHDALADAYTLDEIERHFTAVRGNVVEAVRALPPHAVGAAA